MVHDSEATAPRNALAIGNDRWEDDIVQPIDYESQVSGTSLDPGEEVVAAEIISNDRDVQIYINALGTTRHPGDISDSGTAENIVEYRVEAKPDNPTDSYNPLPGMRTTAPFGNVVNPTPLIPPGKPIGPMYSVRVVFFNRSGDRANPQSVDVNNVGAVLRGQVSRQSSTTGGGN